MLKRILFLLLFLIALFSTYSIADGGYIPDNAKKYIPDLIQELNVTESGIDKPEYFAALIEHESCISLKHSRCWSPTAELKTSREEGVGLGQITRAWHKDGRLRFDTIANLKRRYSSLSELEWDNIRDRPDLQIRAIVLLWYSNYKRFENKGISEMNRIAMADAAYNGGLRDVLRERKKCGLMENCDPDEWFDNVEKYCTKSKRILYGNRNACDINRHHVEDVLHNRLNKYEAYLEKIKTNNDI
jgi:hypothetical protein